MRFLVFFLYFLSITSFAAKDPVAWRLNQSFPNTVTTGTSYNITYTLTNQLPFQLSHPLTIEKSASPDSDFTYADNCTGQRLQPQASCTVEVTLTPVMAGMISFQLIMGYDNNQVPLPKLLTTAVGQNTNTAIIQASVSTAMTNPLSLGNSSNYGFTFKNIGLVKATSVSASSSASGYSSSCGTYLDPGDSCTVTGTYTPSSATPTLQSVVGSFAYAEGSTVTATDTISISTSSGVVGLVLTPLPSVMAPSATANYGFKFCNQSSSAITITDLTVSASPVVGIATNDPPGTTNNCSTGTLPGGVDACCQVLGTYTAPASPQALVTVTEQLSFTGTSGSPVTVSSSTVVGTVPATRVINVVNSCGFAISVSMSGAALGSGDYTAPCSTNGCPNGSSCDTTTGVCFFQNYTPTNTASGNNVLNSGDTGKFTIPSVNTPDPVIQWSGGISASLNCAGNPSCLYASCGNGTGTTSCTPGSGFTTPSTQAEFTLLYASGDSYDTTVINGFHIPIQMAPDAPVLISNYSCGTSGYKAGGNGFGACVWTKSVGYPPSHQYYWVSTVSSGTAGTCTLSSPNTCNAGYLCGLTSTQVGTANQPTAIACGAFLGFWTGDEVCGSANVPQAIRDDFNCDTQLSTLTTPSGPSFSPTPPGYTPPLTLGDLMLCSVAQGYTGPILNTCYQVYPTSGTPSYSSAQIQSCCGCVDWWTVSYNGSAIGANNTANTCAQYGTYNTDPVWTQYIQGTLSWMKAACPSAYVYPFDDKTSTFGCSNVSSGNPSNTVNYTITFCPGGDSGLPTGTNEGRT